MAVDDKQNESPPVRPDLFERRSVRLALFIGIPAIIFILVCAGIRISQYGIDHTIFVFGQKELVSGWPAAIRVTLSADNLGEFFLPTRLTGHLVRGNQRHLLFDGPVNDQGFALARNFRVPDLPRGPAEFELDVRFDERRRIVRAKVEIVSEPPEENTVVPQDTNLKAKLGSVDKDDFVIQAFTEDRGAPTGLESVVFMRAKTKDGAPKEADLEVALTGAERKGADKKVSTDRLGLAALLLRPTDMSMKIQVAGARPQTDPGSTEDPQADAGAPQPPSKGAELAPPLVYSGICASVHNPIVSGGEPVKLSAWQISSIGPVYADLFHKGRWVQGTSSYFNQGRAVLEIEPVKAGLHRIQITTSALAPGRAVAVRHFYRLSPGEDPSAGLRSILSLLKSSPQDRDWAESALAMPLETGAGFDRSMTAAFAFSRLYEGHQVIPRLIYSRQEDDEELGAFKARFQRTIMIVILCLGLCVAGLISLSAIKAHQRQTRISLMFADQRDGEDQETARLTRAGARSERVSMLIHGAILFLVIIGAFIAIALFVDTMTWNQ